MEEEDEEEGEEEEEEEAVDGSRDVPRTGQSGLPGGAHASSWNWPCGSSRQHHLPARAKRTGEVVAVQSEERDGGCGPEARFTQQPGCAASVSSPDAPRSAASCPELGEAAATPRSTMHRANIYSLSSKLLVQSVRCIRKLGCSFLINSLSKHCTVIIQRA